MGLNIGNIRKTFLGRHVSVTFEESETKVWSGLCIGVYQKNEGTGFEFVLLNDWRFVFTPLSMTETRIEGSYNKNKRIVTITDSGVSDGMNLSLDHYQRNMLLDILHIEYALLNNKHSDNEVVKRRLENVDRLLHRLMGIE